MIFLALGAYALFCFAVGVELGRSNMSALISFAIVGLIAIQLGFLAGSFLSE